MRTTHLLLGLVALGAFLLVISFFLPSMVGGKRAWTEKQAIEHAKSSATLHRLKHEQGHAMPHPPEEGPEHADPAAEKAKAAPQVTEADVEEAQANYNRTSGELRWAQSPFQGMATLLQWSGAICVLGGATGYFVLCATPK